MPALPIDLPSIQAEHSVLCRSMGAVQARCSRVMTEQSAHIARLQAQVIQLRAKAILLQSQLAWTMREPVPTVDASADLLQKLPLTQHALASATRASFHAEWPETNQVFCQVACLSCSAFWRGADDQCRRSETTCTVQAADEACATPHSASFGPEVLPK